MHDCTYGALCIHCTCGWLRERERQRALLDPELLHNESESEREREREREREKETTLGCAQPSRMFAMHICLTR
jgi:hypothetical protein